MSIAHEITIEALERDPYPIYARLRQESPVAWVPAANVWFATRWEDVEVVTKSPDIFTAEAPTSPVELSFGKPTILTVDGDQHKQLRGGIDPHYRPRKVAEYVQALVTPIAEEFLAKFESAGRADLMADYFEPISVLSLARSFGFGDLDVATLRRWFHGLSQGAINYEQDPKRQEISDKTCAEIDAVTIPMLERLREAPDSSPLSHMLHHNMPEGETRPAEFILPSVKVTLLGGMQEPGHGAGSTLVGLLQNPEQMEALLADTDRLLPKAVAEGLRWVAPIGTQMRLAQTDIELGGVTIPAGSPVAAILASANRDESRFAAPDRFDIHREETSMATFGFGHHFCAGRWFAAAQIEIALRLLLSRLPHLKLDPDNPPEFRGWEFRAPTTLHITFPPAH
ncbi:cytochrome P450 [Pelagibacterium halotolerans]|uniref:cytochrome P450 n=1 Tax=Pelagibacterium halotolerans TaxID=531813 RepID=UPI0038508CDF